MTQTNELEAQARPRGRLITLQEAAERGHMSTSTLRMLLAEGFGPPAFKRPRSNRWLLWTREFDDWLESNRADA
jgi:hypothetical protein